MSAPRLFCRELHVGACELEPEESHHGTNVLRLRRGDDVSLFDGRGGEASALVTEVRRRTLVVTVEQVLQRPFDLSRRLTVAVAMPRAHRQGTLIEKCTELGAAAFLPIVSERSVVQPERDAVPRWTRRAIEAARQCRRAWVPRVHEPVTFVESLERATGFDRCAVAHPVSEAALWSRWLSDLGRDSSALLWVGPEGGWADDEIAACGRAGAACVRLSPTLLRTETAAIAACAVLAAIEDGVPEPVTS